MKDILDFVGLHPVLTVLLVLIAADVLITVAVASHGGRQDGPEE